MDILLIQDSINNNVLFSEHIALNNAPEALAISNFSSVLDKIGFEQYHFTDIRVTHHTNNFCLVPKDLFDAEYKADYLKYNTPVPNPSNLSHDEINACETIVIYEPLHAFNDQLLKRLETFEYHHFATPFLTYALGNSTQYKPYAWVNLQKNKMQIAITNDKRLQFYNQFEIHSTYDYLYYLLFSLEQLNISSEEIETHLFGMSASENELIKLSRNYIKTVVHHDEGMLLYNGNEGYKNVTFKH